MKENVWIRVAGKIFSVAYLLFYVAAFGAILFLSLSTHLLMGRGPGFVIFVVPLLGIFSGYWMFKGMDRAWKKAGVFVSLLFSAFLAVFVIFVMPVIIKTNADKVSVQSAPGDAVARQQFFDGVAAGRLDEVKVWLSQGMDVNAANEFGETALHVVRDADVARYLIAAGANVNARDNDLGMTPIFYQEVPIAKLLAAAGADINARSHKGNTPLIWHVYSGYREGIEYLLSVGADINAANDDGNTALDVAETFADRWLADYLTSRGVRRGR